MDSGSATPRSRAKASGLARYRLTSSPLRISVSNLEMTRALQLRACSIWVILHSRSSSSMDVIGQLLIVAIYAGPSRTIAAGRPIVWQDFQSAHVAYGVKSAVLIAG